jgi:hypothetical protein
MITYHEVEQGSDEWKELRAGKYTGSNADKLLKHGAIEYSLTASGSFNGNFWTKRGHILELEAIELYEAIKGVRVDRDGFVTNSKFDRCGYSPDGVVDRKILIEIKCFDVKNHLAIWNGDIPFKIAAQIHFGLTILELQTAHLVIYNPTLDPAHAFKIIEIKARPAIRSNFIQILSKGVLV